MIWSPMTVSMAEAIDRWILRGAPQFSAILCILIIIPAVPGQGGICDEQDFCEGS